MIEMLDSWVLESYRNANIFIGITMVILIGSIIVLYVMGKKIGKPDERTNLIYLKVVSCMFTTQIIMNGVFIIFVNNNIENSGQIFILFQGIVFLVGAIYSIKLYRIDFK